MNELTSLLLATTVLALGGVGLYMYTSQNDETPRRGGKKNSEENSWFGSSGKDDEIEDEDLNEEDNSEFNDFDEDFIEPRARSRGGKTKRARSKATGSKRRH